MPLKTDASLALTLAASRSNPRLFVTDILRAEPEPWQAEALGHLATSDRVAIRAGHGVGKTAFLCWAIYWFALTRRDWVIPVTANSQDQLRDVVWAEMMRWHRRLPAFLADGLEITAERITLKEAPENFIVARTASKDRPEALQGFHARNMLFAIEEASGIPEEVFEVAQGALSTAGAKVIMGGNPTRGEGFFYRAFHSNRDRWTTMRVSSQDVPRARAHIADIAANYGADSNIYRVRVLGEFPTGEDDSVIPLHLCESAVARAVEPSEAFRVVWGLDVARFGDDRTALAKRRGNVLLEPIKHWSSKDTMQVCGLIVDEYKSTFDDEQPSEIVVDSIGLGAGVVDRLLELGLPVRGLNVGEQPAAKARFMRSRDELWFAARDWLARLDSKLPKDDALIAELTAPKFTISSSGKVQVERKEDLKKRGQRSPDLADAFIMTFAGGLESVPDQAIDRYRAKLKKHSRVSAWAA